MMKYLYSLIIIVLLIQYGFISLPGAFVQEGRDGPRSPADQILYVSPGGNGSCITSWVNACELQTALGAAVPGDELWVQAGTYKPTTGSDRTATFTLKSGVSLYGGFNGTESLREQRNWVTQVTTLSGDIGAAGNNADNSYHVVTGSGGDRTALLDGFTVAGGNANGADPHNRGGGMYNYGGSPSIANAIFSSNTAIYGGGMFNDNSSSPSLVNVTFSGNTATAIGGGIYNYDSSNPIAGKRDLFR